MIESAPPSSRVDTHVFRCDGLPHQTPRRIAERPFASQSAGLQNAPVSLLGVGPSGPVEVQGLRYGRAIAGRRRREKSRRAPTANPLVVHRADGDAKVDWAPRAAMGPMGQRPDRSQGRLRFRDGIGSANATTLSGLALGVG